MTEALTASTSGSATVSASGGATVSATGSSTVIATVAAAVPASTTAPEWVAICQLQDIPVLGARRVARPRGAAVALFRAADDHVFALLDRCPHKGGPLSQGIVFGHSVACPLHNWTIGLADGCARAPDVGCTTPFAVQVRSGEVALDGLQLRTLAIDEAKAAA